MKIAIMQPYIFPYLGYFQLLDAVDTFVFFDDVQYKRRSYITRNAVLMNGSAHKFSIPTQKVSREAAICDVEVHEVEYFNWRDKFLKSLEHGYAKAPHFKEVFALVQSILDIENLSMSHLAKDSVIKTAEYIGLSPRFLQSSKMPYDRSGDGQDKIISISKQLQAKTYINAINGRELYDKAAFRSKDISLNFIEPILDNYPQSTQDFVSHLSIIDLMMFLSPEDLSKHLKNYNLIN